jgi:hypothetical protein
VANPSYANIKLISMIGIAGVVEIIGGALVTVGLFTRVAAFIMSGRDGRALCPYRMAALWKLCYVLFCILLSSLRWSRSMERRRHTAKREIVSFELSGPVSATPIADVSSGGLADAKLAPSRQQIIRSRHIISVQSLARSGSVGAMRRCTLFGIQGPFRV